MRLAATAGLTTRMSSYLKSVPHDALAASQTLEAAHRDCPPHRRTKVPGGL